MNEPYPWPPEAELDICDACCMEPGELADRARQKPPEDEYLCQACSDLAEQAQNARKGRTHDRQRHSE